MARAFDELNRMSAGELASRMRAREISPVEAVEACIARIEAVNPKLNAVVADRFAEARVEAKAAEARLAGSGEQPPLLGVPCTIKEVIGLSGMPQTAGSYWRRGRRATQDAVTVARLKAAGCIPLGVTNVAECCFWFENSNLLYGRTNNPYNLRRHPGGSSGGEAAIVAAGGSPLGLGSDVGGSIRMPSFFCGIFGHKPSHGEISFAGHWPFCEGELAHWAPGDSPYTEIGPLARTTSDLTAALRVLRDPEAPPLQDPRTVDWRGKRVVLLTDPKIRRVFRATPELQDAAKRAAEHLAGRGARIEEIEADVFADAVLIWACSLAAVAGPRMDHLIAGGHAPSVTVEALHWLRGRPRHTLPVLQYFMGEILFRFVGKKAAYIDAGHRLAARLTTLLADDAVLIMPPHPRVAPRHNRPMLRPFDYAFTGIFNIMRFPVTAVPLGLNSEGLPLGVQVIAAHGRDHLTLAAAHALEEGFGGWVAPKL